MIIKEYPVLYNQKANGLIQIHKLRVELQDDGTCRIYSSYGQLNGVLTESYKIISSGKNIGRSNETTIVDQAIFEADSIFQKKLDKKYTESLEDVGKNIGLDKTIPDPMLAKDFAEHCHKVRYPAFVQPKLDGVRCIARKEDGDIVLYTRGGKQIPFMYHIKDELKNILDEGEILDGELYSPDITFQQIISIVRKTKSEDKDSHLIQYHIYDYPIVGLSFEDRNKLLNEKINFNSDFLKLVETQIVYSLEDIDAFHTQMKRLGYEGTMVRNARGLYRFKYRSDDLLKYKDFIDEEFLITGIRDDTGPNGDECIFICNTDEGKEFLVRSTGTSEYRAELISIKDTLISKMLTVKYQEKTDDGIPRFPVGVGIRDYE